MRIAMVGTGYVGLVSGACFADFGHHVTCIDLDSDKIADLNNGQMPIFEPGLEQLVSSNVKEGRLEFTTEMSEVVASADAVLLLLEPHQGVVTDLLILVSFAKQQPKFPRLCLVLQ